MNLDFTELHSELLVMKQELESRLLEGSERYMQEFAAEPLIQNKQDEKRILIQKHIQDDLKDVKRALVKLKFGIYGYCEDTGERIPFDKLKTIPTARSIHDFCYSELVKL
jgi:RNA polymerase-binding transcription factor DksA